MLNQKQLNERILTLGTRFFDLIGSETPSIFNKNWWTGKVMDWSMSHDDFKVQLFRFIDVLPYLTTDEMLAAHIREYFAEEKNVPTVLRWGAKSTGLGGKLGTKVLGATIRKNLERMALDFIIGGTVDQTCKNLAKLRKQGYAFTLDILGEAVISETEAEAYARQYMDLLEGLGATQSQWPALEGSAGRDWNCAPKINISVKPSALYSQADPADFAGTVNHIVERLKPIYRKVLAHDGFLCLDTEMRALKEVNFEVYRKLRSDPEFKAYPNLGLALQVYLQTSDQDIDGMLDWVRDTKLPISIRLVKGAYWDYEIVHAAQLGHPLPVYSVKAQSDMAFERAVYKILSRHDLCHLACASHNVRSVCAVMAMADQMKVPADAVEYQALFGMAEPFRKALLKMTGRVRLYCPQGELLPGMAYLIRRLLENTSNESFLRQTFVEGRQRQALLEDPQQTYQRTAAEIPALVRQAQGQPGVFKNDALADFSLAAQREKYQRAIEGLRTQLGRTYGLHIDGRDIECEDRIDSVNPADPGEILGRICQAGTDHVDQAVAAAQRALSAWRDVTPRERAVYLVKAASLARERLFELAAWQTLEAGKQWSQAYADVTEAIDFLEYYAREIVRLAEPQNVAQVPGEVNQYRYQPKGVAAIIAPWNFPLAISCGMCAAALAAGAPVVYKPSNQSPIVGHTLLRLFRDAGLPAGVFNYVPGRGSVMGDHLVDHPDIAIIGFTGSMDVGLRIIERAAKTPAVQPSVKRVICEMGGKNAIVIDDDADLDVAVPHVIYSAFGYQGQKCSACSRLIICATVYDRFVTRLIAAARSLQLGPAEDPANHMGPVIDAAAQKSILKYAEIAKQEGRLLYESPVPDQGYYVPVTIVDGITPAHRIAQEEVFGPVLAVMKAQDFDQAIEWANSTRFALTGGVFSRSPQHLDQARREFRVGNLYLNRGSTGALVGRQPFGGFKMSGVGSKAGGPDYLLQFMDPRTITENTMRRGFVPVADVTASSHAVSPTPIKIREQKPAAKESARNQCEA